LKFGVVVFPGSNCDHDAFYSVKSVIKQDVEFIWHKEKKIGHLDCIILPGGFSYGDYLRTGSIARFAPVMNSISDYAENGGLLVGICNGFQILTELKLLPGALLMNSTLRFICKHVHIKAENAETPFTNKIREGQILKIPIAHKEGNYFISPEELDKLEKNRCIVFKYCDENGKIIDSANPNGSLDNIAGICNEKRNILGMMPHPERAMEDVLGSSDGKIIFESIVDFIRNR